MLEGGGAEGAFAPPPEFGGSEKRIERETGNLLIRAPPESKSERSFWMISMSFPASGQNTVQRKVKNIIFRKEYLYLVSGS